MWLVEYTDQFGAWFESLSESEQERSIRALFAFDPRRTAILLIGGDKSPDDPESPNWNAWYCPSRSDGCSVRAARAGSWSSHPRTGSSEADGSSRRLSVLTSGVMPDRHAGPVMTLWSDQ